MTPENFGRIAAQTAKQVIQQRIREAERAMMYDEYVDRVGEVVTGIVQQAGDRNNILVDLGKVEALLPRSEQVDGERYEQGSRIKAVITEVRSGTKGPQVILSRRDSELIKTLFELEVPEIADGLVEIRGVAREPGYRSKIAVESHAQGVDPVGACVGPRGSRVRMVVSELRGEKIDIIPWNDEPARFIAKALSPARVREVLVDDESREATVARPGRPALARDRQGGPERPPRRAPDRLEGRHRVRDRVRAGRGRGGLRRRRRGRRRLLRPLLGRPLERQALPERRAPELALLRHPGAPRARGARGGRGRTARHGRRRPSRRRRRRSRAARRGGADASPPSRRLEAPVAGDRGGGDAETARAPRRASRLTCRERACPHVRGLRAQGAAVRAPPLRGAGRDAGGRPRGGACRAGARTPAAARRASSARGATARSRARCGARCAVPDGLNARFGRGLGSPDG